MVDYVESVERILSIGVTSSNVSVWVSSTDVAAVAVAGVELTSSALI
jgi:hypothetical protein